MGTTVYINLSQLIDNNFLIKGGPAPYYPYEATRYIAFDVPFFSGFGTPNVIAWTTYVYDEY